MTEKLNKLTLTQLGINAYKEPILFLREDAPICRSEGFAVHARVKITLNKKCIMATINTIDGTGKNLLSIGQASLSEYAWYYLEAKEGDVITIAHSPPLSSLSHLRSKIYGNTLSEYQIQDIIDDIAHRNYSDITISAFITACAGGRLNLDEIIYLTRAMVRGGKKLIWPKNQMIVDKHCVGGLPGNRTTPIIVPIVAEFGLFMPKTSSRAITSPAGTADTMEVLAPVELDIVTMQNVVKSQGGCVVWGGSAELSPSDDIMVQIERSLDLDSEGQLVASVLSKKISAGSTHILIDIPIGPTAKVRTMAMAQNLKDVFERVSLALNIHVKIIFSDGTQPIGRGIGPALEAQDVVDVLQNKPDAPHDLKERALELAGYILEFSPDVKSGEGKKIATSILESGRAWTKFQAICAAQGGMKKIPIAPYFHDVLSEHAGQVIEIDNRYIARVAKLAGAPTDVSAGVALYVNIGTLVEKNQVLYRIFAETKGELAYALSLLKLHTQIIKVEPL
jgi:thymidine phosphorylase